MISVLTQYTLCGLQDLTVLDLRENDLIYVHPLSFTIVMNLQVLESSMQGLCCYNDFQMCSPKFDDDFASCTNILGDQALKYSVWSIAVFLVIENIAALCVFRSFKSYKSKKRVIHAFY